MSLAGYLKSASDALTLIRARDPRAWPIAEALAVRDRDACLNVVLERIKRGPIPAFTPILETERDLVEVFGSPDESPKRILFLHKPQRQPQSALTDWWRELRAGTRTVHDSDALKRAAGEELKAREHARAVACTECRQARGRWYGDRWICETCAVPPVALAVAPVPAMRAVARGKPWRERIEDALAR